MKKIVTCKYKNKTESNNTNVNREHDSFEI